jgi:CW-type Zinc Finger
MDEAKARDDIAVIEPKSFSSSSFVPAFPVGDITTATTATSSSLESAHGKRSPVVDPASAKRIKHEVLVEPHGTTEETSPTVEGIFGVTAAGHHAYAYDDRDAGSIFGQTAGSSNLTCSWIQCDRCKKWRRLRGGLDEKKHPTPCYCSMNENDPGRARCSVPEEDVETSDTIESAANTRTRNRDDGEVEDDEDEEEQGGPQKEKGNSETAPPPPLDPIVPSHSDVLLAPRHGTDYRQYSGNVKLSFLIKVEREKYHGSNHKDKAEMIKEVVRQVKLQFPQGR